MNDTDQRSCGVSALVVAARVRIQTVRDQLDVLRQRIAELDVELRSLAAEELHLQALLEVHDPSQPQIAPSAEPRDIRGAVVELLTERGQMHYRRIEQELRQRGLYTGGGKDPANSLLARYFDDPRLYRPARGVYAVNTDGLPAHSVGKKRRRRINKL